MSGTVIAASVTADLQRYEPPIWAAPLAPPRGACACCGELQSLPSYMQAVTRINAISQQLQCQPCAAILPVTAASGGSPLDDQKARACAAVDGHAAALRELNLLLFRNPEVAYEEHKAHEGICTFLESMGHSVERKYLGMETAFRTQVGSGTPVVIVCAEYDALPGIGHACGHNLICTAAVAAFLGMAQALAEESGKEATGRGGGKRGGTLVLLGTPAEEAGGGKVDLLRRGAFDGVDVAMMVHPSPANILYPKMLAWQWANVSYHGRPAHASVNPHQGINALDAQISLFGSIGLLRQQLHSSLHVHGIILNGGDAPNIIPYLTESKWICRAPSERELEELKTKVIRCFEAAGIATGCRVEIEWLGNAYANVVQNETMAEAFRANSGLAFGTGAAPFAPKQYELTLPPGGSSDFGNVSWAVPGIHPTFKIDTPYGNHHPGFTEAAGKESAHHQAVGAGKAMAMTALDLFADDTLLEAAKVDFAKLTAR
eukprot:gnl/TRDRNA2_/TRDRNA2_200213_c0_seq1.p1 gnl/TRDRNA2_/TRDRNA2_200213_c0~~gnl/TRDRNA2_/TRDRNA2_200213_c0_seq1.p1  ORF type:complete len:488 (+),score=86.06 gnl/TRDRNA2_/TRDRNA2_200213_c0_seq1:57-1520(+)